MKKIILILFILFGYLSYSQPGASLHSIVFKVIDENGLPLTLNSGSYQIAMQTYIRKTNSDIKDSLVSLFDINSSGNEIFFFQDNSQLNYYYSYLRKDSCFSLNVFSISILDDIIIEIKSNRKNVKFIIKGFLTTGFICFNLGLVENQTYLCDISRIMNFDSKIKLHYDNKEILDFTPQNDWKFNIYKTD